MLRIKLQLFAEQGDEGTKAKEGGSDKTTNSKEKEPQNNKDNKDSDLEKLRAEFEKYKADAQSETDKRVTDAIKKTQKKMSEQHEEEKRLAQLTDEEKRAEEDRRRQAEHSKRERDLAIKELKLNLVDVLTEEDLNLNFRELIDVSSLLNIEDAETRKNELITKVKSVKGIFTSLVEEQVENIKKEYLKGNTPDKVGGQGTNTPIDDYTKAKKNTDVKGMLKAKFKKTR